ncbi:hypothetical protein BsWGS_01505 [Bradybaena similaris]
MEESNDPDEVKIVIESLFDTFVKYLNPHAIINSNTWIESHKGEFLSSQPSREAAVQNLLGWILDDDAADKTAARQFTTALTQLTYETEILHLAISGGTDDEKLQLSKCMREIVSLLDGSLIRNVSLEELSHVQSLMLRQGIITEKACSELNLIQNAYECSLKMLKSIKRGKPDWPLVVFPILRSQNQDLMQHQQLHLGELTEHSEATTNVPQQNTDKDSENQMEIFTSSELTGLAEFDDAFSDYTSFSTISSTRSSRLIYLTKDQQDETAMQILIDAGNVDVNIITSDPSFEKSNRFQHKSAYSDGEDNEEMASNATECNEIPDLKLRKYQYELAENALKGRNTIICAPTGSGKTRVATYIILNHLQRKAENEERKVAFLARTVPLVMQQCKGLKKYLPKTFEVTSLTGDSEDSMHLHFIIPDNDVIVMTPRILENHLKRKCLPHLGTFSMLVFDECHHTRKGEPYNTLMYSYLKTKKQITEAEENGDVLDIKLPQIVGLTASISVEKAVQDEGAVKCILEVCGNLDAETISCVKENEDELKQTVPVPKEILIKLRELEKDEAVEKIMKIMTKLEAAVVSYVEEIKNDGLKTLLKKIPSDKKSQQYGQWTVKIRNMAKAFPRQEKRETFGPVRALIIIAYYLAAYNVALELHDLVLLRHVLAYLDKCFTGFSQNKNRSTNENFYFEDFEELKKLMTNRKDIENPNLTRLKDTLFTYLIEKGKESRGIIFVRTRALTEALASWLNTCSESKLRDLKATVFTGTAASVDEGGMTTAEQDEILQRFKSGDVRLLVSTSVGEEGIDIPECRLVIKYNHVGNEVTTVQTRGRSRMEGGMSILLAMDTIIRKERINQEKAKMMEKAIKKISQMKRAKIRRMNKIHQQQMMKDEEIQQIVKAQEESLLLKKDFKMVCHMCRKVVIDSKDIKTIYKTHHVVVNRDILSQTKTIPYSGAKYIDDIKLIGSVRCMGEPEEGKHCYSKLGSMMVYSKIPFVVIGIKYFGFDSNAPLGLEFYNKWKNVPYAVDEIGPSDFERYLPEKKQPRSITDGSEDDDSDDDSDDDNPSHTSVKTNISTNTQVPSELVHSDNPGSATEQNNMLSSQDGKNSDGVNKTELNRLLDRSQGHVDRDSEYPKLEGTADGSRFPSDLTQGITEVKGATGDNNLAINVGTNTGSAISAQPSVISSFKSNEEYHNTPLMPVSQVRHSETQIEGFKLLKHTQTLLAPTMFSDISDFHPLPQSQPLCDPSASINSDDDDSFQSNARDESNSTDLIQTTSNRSAENTSEVGGDNVTPSNRSAGNTPGVGGDSVSPFKRSAENTPEVCGDNVTPSKRSAGNTPGVGGDSVSPFNRSAENTPEVCGDNVTPSKRNAGNTPGVGGDIVSPSNRSAENTPEVCGDNVTPSKRNAGNTPGIGGDGNTPGVGGDGNTPGVGGDGNTPGVGGDGNTPGVGGDGNTPGVGGDGNTPGVGGDSVTPSNRSAENTPGVGGDSNNENTTVLKAAVALSDANVGVQQEQPRPNISDDDNMQRNPRQPMSGLNLL